MKRQRNPKGIPSIDAPNGRLRIRITWQGQRRTMFVGMPDNANGKKLAESICREIEKDISLSCFDVSMKKYRDMTPNKLSNDEVEAKSLTLFDLWQKYIDFKKPQVEETTYEMKYKHVSQWIIKLPTTSLDDAIAIRDYLLKETSPPNAKYLLSQFSSCCRWAVRSKLIASNVFDKLNTDIVIKHGEEADIEVFSRSEMQAIVEAFKDDHYFNFVRFLFFTGCRTSEAIGLQWKGVNLDANKIVFNQAIVKVGGTYKIKGLKTQEKREFPTNKALREFLLEIKPENVDPNEFVFKPTERTITRHINRSAFHDNHWEPIIRKLVDEAKISQYLSQYATRHTFITLALQAGVDVSTVAKWVGNSPETIYKHYAGFNRESLPPEF